MTADVLGCGPAVLFDRGPSGGVDLFRAPREVLRAWTLDEVLPVLRRAEALRGEGLWIAGLAAYEAGFALDPALRAVGTALPEGPLLEFGVFEGVEDGEPLQDRACALAETPALSAPRPLWSREAYLAAFDAVKAGIRKGEWYQANLTMPLEMESRLPLLALWGALVQAQPVQHGAFVALGDRPVLSRSPESFFRIHADGQIVLTPMKGTMPRDPDPVADEAARRFLMEDEKNRAENVMIVDLIRNDVSRISRTGTVHVPDLCVVESFATVHQMVSRVTADLLPGVGLPEIFEALFPCGSITGAPKIAAMKALRALEHGPRGPYCGAIGWMAPDGQAAFNVAIRTLVAQPGGGLRLDVGGGIVQDSRGDDEYEEALWKARFATLLSRD